MQQAQHGKNRLQFEKSPYLLQHAENPVNWFPWGAEAFAKAQHENKPIFLSIGYSTCHWCHVMERESFEDADVARLLNEVFVAVKVDREERPDLDNLYMAVCQMLTGSGGWPLTIVMTPDKKPFFAGTYFPKTSRFGRIGLLELIPRIQAIWLTQRAQAVDAADQVIAGLHELSDTASKAMRADDVLDETVLQAAYRALAGEFDAHYGGFGAAPKFPTPHLLMLLLRYWKRTGELHALTMVEQTLQAMRRGGIYDHLGFGFHRYATDARWLLPHFEKMLYDQALLALAYLEAYQATHKAEYAQTAREIFTYVLRDMTAPEGGFYSAEDADSEGVEGKFYLWTVADIRAALPQPDAALFLKLYNFAEQGNFQEQSANLPAGENIVHLQQSIAELTENVGMMPDALHTQIERIRQMLFAIRAQRVHPQKDDKILTDWNGLMIAALAKGAQVLDEPRYAEAAARSAEFIVRTLRDANGRLLHRYRDGEAGVPAYLDDYAFLIWGLIELYETTFEAAYLEQALALNAGLLQHFWDQQQGGFFFTVDDAEDLPVRQKQIYDGAIPSGNSVALLNLLRLARMTANPDLEAKAAQITRLFAEAIRKLPTGHTFFLLGVDFGLGPSQEVVLVGDPDAQDMHTLLQALRREFLPNKVVLLRPSNQEAPEILRFAPYIAQDTPLNKTATVYVCRNYACRLPTTAIDAMLAAFQ